MADKPTNNTEMEPERWYHYGNLTDNPTPGERDKPAYPSTECEHGTNLGEVVCADCERDTPTNLTSEQLEPRALIHTNEPWHPAMGWSPAPAVTDEAFGWVIKDFGREGVSWIRVHVEGQEVWFNLANVVSITEERPDAR